MKPPAIVYKSFLISVLVTMFFSSFSYGQNFYFENELRCLAESARKDWKMETESIEKGTEPIPSFTGNFEKPIRWKLSGYHFCKAIEIDKESEKLRKENPKFWFDNSLNYFSDQINADEAAFTLSVAAFRTGQIANIFNSYTTAFTHAQCWSQDYATKESCQSLFNTLLGVYIFLERMNVRYIDTAETDSQIAKLKKSISAKMGEASFPLGERIKIRTIAFIESHDLNDLLIIIGHLEEIQKKIKSGPDESNAIFAKVNLWRTYFSFLKLAGDSANRSYERQRSESADKLTALVPDIVEAAFNFPQNVNAPFSARELYADIYELRQFYLQGGELQQADHLSLVLGDLRTRSELITPSLTKRFIERYTWGLLTGYGTSLFRVFASWVLLIFSIWLFFLLHLCPPQITLGQKPANIFSDLLKWFTKSLRLGHSGTALRDAVAIMTLQSPETKMATIPTVGFRFISLLFVSCATGYLLIYLSNASLR